MAVTRRIIFPSEGAHICHASACRRRMVEKTVARHTMLCVASWRVAKPRDACVAQNTSRDCLSRKCSAACGVCKSRVCKILNSVVGCSFARLGVYVGNSSVGTVKTRSRKLSCHEATYDLRDVRLEQVVACIVSRLLSHDAYFPLQEVRINARCLSACRRRRVKKPVSGHAMLCVARWRVARPRGACVAVNTSRDCLS